MLRLRRDVRAEELRRLVGDARGQDDRGAGDVRGRGERRGQLVPDAHRRRAVPAPGRRAHRAPGGHPGLDGGGAMARNPVTWLGSPAFPTAARTALADDQLRRNLKHATGLIRTKRAAAVAELPDWEDLRRAGEAIKDDVLANLDTYLLRLEELVTARGG